MAFDFFGGGGGGGGGGGIGMGQGSIGGALISANSLNREIDRAKKLDKWNYEQLLKSQQQQDIFPFAFGGGSGDLLTKLGERYRGVYDDILNLGSDVSDRAGQFTAFSDRFRPLQDKSEQLSSDLISGVVGQQRRTAAEPVYEARTRSADLTESGELAAINEALNRIEARSREGGFAGDSLATGRASSDVVRRIASQVAAQRSAAEVANAMDAANLENLIINEQLSARGEPTRMLGARAAYESLPERLAVESALGPDQAFTAAVAPYMRNTQPPPRFRKHYPAESTIWGNVGAQALDMVEKLGWSVIQSYMGGAGGMMGGAGGAAGGAGGGGGGMMGMFGGLGGGDSSGGAMQSFNNDALDRYGASLLGGG